MTSPVAVDAKRRPYARIADLTIIRETLQAALEAGCEDLITCAHSPESPCRSPVWPTTTQRAIPSTMTPMRLDAWRSAWPTCAHRMPRRCGCHCGCGRGNHVAGQRF